MIGRQYLGSGGTAPHSVSQEGKEMEWNKEWGCNRLQGYQGTSDALSCFT